jgi:SAM-dependent methyltransferase
MGAANMGIDVETARFLLARRREGASFERCATLGRQHCYFGNKETTDLLRNVGLDAKNFPQLFPKEYPRYSEPFWEMLGAKELVTIDASNFEGATRVHDMNQPIPPEWKESFDIVCDIGTLEHIFNFPTAIRNCLEMVKAGGHFFAQTPANNNMGHGFYQFSPELYFRILSPKNGFRIEHFIAIEYGPRRRWFAVKDPETVRARVTVINSYPVGLCIWAKRTEIKPLLADTPQQSDYASAWAEHAGPAKSAASSDKLARLRRTLIETIPRFARTLDILRFSRFNRKHSFRNTKSFERVSKRDAGGR